MAEADENTHDATKLVNIYLLWRSSEGDKFRIQARFSPEVKFDFECLARLSDGRPQDKNPCIYRLSLNLIQNSDEQLGVNYKNTLHLVERYQLRISQKGYLYNSSKEEDILRKINDIDSPHHFLFDVVFQSSQFGTFI